MSSSGPARGKYDHDDERGASREELKPEKSGVPANELRIPAGFTRSMLPNSGAFFSSLVAPLQAQLRAMMPNYKNMFSGTSMSLNVPTVSARSAVLPTLATPAIRFATEEALKRITEQYAELMAGLRTSLRPLIDPETLRGFNRALLPPNLRAHADDIRASDIYRFVAQEGIPLYLVPRGRTALRLLRATNRAGRRRVLGDCYDSLIEDCASVLERADHESIREARSFVLDGLGAMQAGYTRSAQAMLTVTLDSLIYGFYPDREERQVIAGRKKGAEVPEEIRQMGVRAAFVWLPIWNAHETYWRDRNDKIPRHFSRHASVHAVSARQFSKRNCVQVLMLVTSLIGFADQLAREPS